MKIRIAIHNSTNAQTPLINYLHKRLRSKTAIPGGRRRRSPHWLRVRLHWFHLFQFSRRSRWIPPCTERTGSDRSGGEDAVAVNSTDACWVPSPAVAPTRGGGRRRRRRVDGISSRRGEMDLQNSPWLDRCYWNRSLICLKELLSFPFSW
jgi:hypothetical protein